MSDKFKEHVIYIAVGKWLGMQMVLCNLRHHVLFSKEGHGKTTGTNAAEVTKATVAVQGICAKLQIAENWY
eukprot:8876639-Ditylum_brightwellii.AAC.1